MKWNETMRLFPAVVSECYSLVFIFAAFLRGLFNKDNEQIHLYRVHPKNLRYS